MLEKRSVDLRILKTRDAIKSTFKEMICEMDASNITIKKLTERARIHRKTFYLHYTCIEALSEDLLQEITTNYYKEIDSLSVNAPFTEVNRIFFTFMSKQERYIEKIICTPSYHDFADKLFLSMLNHNRSRNNPYASFSKEEQNIINTFLTITSVNIYRQWLNDNKYISLENLIDLSGRLFMNGISSII